MCGRFTLRTPAKLLASWFQEVHFPVIAPRFNIAPTQQILALRSSPQNRLEATHLRWGLVPSWAKDLKIGNQLINARSETAASKPAFRKAFKSQRCIILADGFYEWKQTSGGKQPFFVQSTDSARPLLCFAGLWERWHPRSDERTSIDEFDKPDSDNPESDEALAKKSIRSTATLAKTAQKEPARQLELFESDSKNSDLELARNHESDLRIVETCTILTTTANGLMARLHNRMPVIFDSTAQAIWLDRDFENLEQLGSLLQPCPNDQLRIHPVSKLVNKPANDYPNCVEQDLSMEYE